MQSLLIRTFQAANLLMVAPVYVNVCQIPFIIMCALKLAMCVVFLLRHSMCVYVCVSIRKKNIIHEKFRIPYLIQLLS